MELKTLKDLNLIPIVHQEWNSPDDAPPISIDLKPIKEDLHKELDDKITIENDANCFALAEATMGAAKNYDVVFGVIMGTGVGGGIVLNGKIHQGRTFIAGEWGHHTLKQKGNSCYCGKNGCVETYLSGPALEKRWKEITGKNETLSSIVNNINN
ncbi:hypothetical protein LCGC14_3093430 [marine sediment metagenome]|uniref:ROK family protein n=1 Tax=marine sediment metagenome TaxID=412755 RepID=A0A0F8WYQ0_9ZZZZ